MPSSEHPALIDIGAASLHHAAARRADSLNRGFVAESLKAVFQFPAALILFVPFSSGDHIATNSIAAMTLIVPLIIAILFWRILVRRARDIGYLGIGVVGIIGIAVYGFAIVYLSFELYYSFQEWHYVVIASLSFIWSAFHLAIWSRATFGAFCAWRWAKTFGREAAASVLPLGMLFHLFRVPIGFRWGGSLAPVVILMSIFATVLEGYSFILFRFNFPMMASFMQSGRLAWHGNDILRHFPGDDTEQLLDVAILAASALIFIFMLILGWLFAQIAVRLRRWSLFLVRDQVDQRRSWDRRPPAVFFRPFSDDSVVLPGEMMSFFVDHRLTASSKRPTLEQELIDIFGIRGPVIAIGRPNEGALPIGASRSYLSDTSWRGEAEKFMRESGLIVICVDRGNGVLWELQRISELRLLKRTIVFLHPSLSNEQSFLSQVVHIIGQGQIDNGGSVPFHIDGQHCIAILSSECGYPVFILSSRQSVDAYSVALKIGFYRIFSGHSSSVHVN